MLSDAQRHQILVEWNATTADVPAGRCVHELVAEQARQRPDDTAVIGDGVRLSYGALEARANRLAHYLRELGVRPEAPIGVCLERGPDLVVALLGVLKAGAAYLPMVPAYPLERLGFMLRDSGARVVLTRPGPLADLCGETEVTCVDMAGDEVARRPTTAPETNTGPDSLAYIIYTSGSTGRPKGTLIEHRSIIRLVCNAGYVELRPDDVVAQAADASFDAATFEIWAPLVAGASLVVLDKATMLDPHALTAALRRDGITTMFLTTALFNQVATVNPGGFGGLRHLLFGGEAVNPMRVAQVLAATPPDRLLHVYGPTETTTFATWHLVRTVDVQGTVPIGRPIGNTTAYVLDESREPVPPGTAGELFIGGPGVARGYLNRPELTEARFVANPFGPGLLYRTGDWVRCTPDGELEFLGRLDQQVKLRGFRIELGEIEALLSMHDDVTAAVAVLREDVPDDKRIVAYLSRRPGSTFDADTAAAFLRERVPDYLVPAAFVVLDTLPLSAHGKIDRSALPPPPAQRPALEVAYEAPQSGVERLVAGIWAEVLGIDRVGLNDDFLALGGDSLRTSRIRNRLEAATGLRIRARDLFAAPTVRHQTDLVLRYFQASE
ncbi:non-ribosomal peptide synthetase [Micromonospora sp. NPDC051196]|uniref:non-ribosomal peptide synthetase n=1 Tax=Micromonospora sp. NPDC051196 TaxID=3155281 RepID=UPI0034248365